MGGRLPCNVVSDWWKHKGGFFTKALGEGAMGRRHSAAQTLDRKCHAAASQWPHDTGFEDHLKLISALRWQWEAIS